MGLNSDDDAGTVAHKSKLPIFQKNNHGYPSKLGNESTIFHRHFPFHSFHFHHFSFSLGDPPVFLRCPLPQTRLQTEQY